MYRQPPVKGGREKVGASIEKEIRQEARRWAARYDVGVSWVIKTILADAFGIKGLARFDEVSRKRKRRQQRKRAA